MNTSLQTRFTRFLIAATLLAILTCTIIGALTVNWYLRHNQGRALADYISERGLREEMYFESISDSQFAAIRSFNEFRDGISDDEIASAMDTLFPVHADGSRRSSDALYDGIFLPGAGQVSKVGAFISSAHPWTEDRARTLYAAFLTIARHAAGITPSQESLWFITPTDDLIIYAPDRPDNLIFYRQDSPSDFSITGIGIDSVSQPAVNPEGRTRCTDLLTAAYDVTGETLTTGCQTPVRESDGTQIGIFGTTLFAEDLFSHAFSTSPDMADDIYFISSDGQLIAHHDVQILGSRQPEQMRELAASIQPESLVEDFTHLAADSGVIFRNPDNFASEAVAFYHLAIPDWFLVVAIPKNRLLQASLTQIIPIFLMLISIGALLLIGTTIFVRRVAIRPLRALTDTFATERLTSPQLLAEAEAMGEREDEIGGLARTLLNYRRRTDNIVTELEEAVSQRTEKLRQLNETKSTFLATMSHELRTPMNGILGVSGALSRTKLSAEQREMLDLVQQSTAMLERQLSDILDITKVEAGKLELIKNPTNLATAVTDLCDFHRHHAQARGLNLQLNVEPAAQGYFMADEVRVKQILTNMITNAIKFTDTGSVTVHMTAEPGEDNRHCITFRVSDTGIGMDAKALSQVFEPYSQPTKTVAEPNRGTGLGLTIAKSLVELMQGEIRVSSLPGQGSTFTVRIPLIRCQTNKLALVTEEFDIHNVGSSLSKTRILLAEDHHVNQRVVQLILGPLGVQLDIVENGEQAIKAAEDNRYDLILMDMRMPVMDGLEATGKIRELEAGSGTHRTPIIMLSANALPEHCEQSLAAGADLHVGKPLTPDRLINAICEMLSPDTVHKSSGNPPASALRA